jgi:acetylornithine deacetylase
VTALDVVDLAVDLMQRPSTSGEEAGVMAHVADLLERRGWSVQRQPVDGDRVNVYATRGAPQLVFSTHLDTVPPYLPPRVEDGVLHGRGACDAKGIAAAMIVAAEQLVADGEERVALLFVVGEEDGSEGAIAAAALEPKGTMLVNGEPTGNRLVTAQKGALKVTLEAAGVAAHSGYPELGRSALDPLLDALARIRAVEWPVDPRLGPTTVNIGRLRGGDAPNVIPAWARAELLVRLVGPAAPVREALLAAAGPDVTVTFPLEIAVLTAPSVAGWEEISVAYASDLPLLTAWGTAYQLGPGTIHVAHTDHEQLPIAELHEGVARYVALARALLGGGPQ